MKGIEIQKNSILPYLFFSLVFIGCQSNSTKEPDMVKRKEYILELIRKVGFIKLPFEHDILNPDFESKYYTNNTSLDTVFFGKTSAQISGFLPDTSNYFCVLLFQTGDLVYPYLLTIDKSGNAIDTADLCLNVCGAPVDIDSSVNRFEIDKDLRITSYYYCHGKVYINDSISKSVEINDKLEANGQIKGDGKIEFKVIKN